MAWPAPKGPPGARSALALLRLSSSPVVTHFFPLAAALAVVTTAAPAASQDNVAQAAVLSRDAEGLMAAGKTDEACAKYDESARLDRRGSSVLDLALCREKQGRTGSAYVLFEEAERKAIEEKRNDRLATARAKKNVLFAKVPRVTVNVQRDPPEGLRVMVGAVVIPSGEYGRPYPVDPGDQEVVATAPGRADHRAKVTVAIGQRKAISIPALAAGGGAAPPPPPKDPPKKDAPPPPKEEPTKEAPPPLKPESRPEPDPEDTEKHRDSGLVIDLGIIAGLDASFVDRAPLASISGTEYRYASATGGEFIGACGETAAVPGAGECEATFDPALDLMLGGQLFVGYGFSDSFQLGARGFLAPRIPTGLHFAGGPSFSLNVVGPLWLGGTFLIGTTVYDADVTGARGSIPDELEDANGASEVGIPKADLASGLDAADAQGTVEPGLMMGGSVEISMNLADWKPVDALAGSFMLSAWPGLMVDLDGGGTALVVPLGLGYRFY